MTNSTPAAPLLLGTSQMTTTSTSPRDLTEFEVQVLREIDEQSPLSPWGAAVGAAYEGLHALGFLKGGLTAITHITPAGRKWLDDHPLSKHEVVQIGSYAHGGLFRCSCGKSHMDHAEALQHHVDHPLSPKADPAAKPRKCRLFRDRQNPKDFRVEYIDDGGCEVAIFCGPDALGRAIHFAGGTSGPYYDEWADTDGVALADASGIGDPAAKPDASVTEASGDGAGAVAFDPTTPLLGTAIIDRFGWDGADENRRFTATLHFPEGPPANLTFATVWDRCRVTIAENASDLPATPSADGPTEEQIVLGESRIVYSRAINEIVKRADKTLHEAQEVTTGAIHEMVVSVHTDLHAIVEKLVDNEIALQRPPSSSPAEPAPPVTSDPVAVVRSYRDGWLHLSTKNKGSTAKYFAGKAQTANAIIEALEKDAALRSSSKGGA